MRISIVSVFSAFAFVLAAGQAFAQAQAPQQQPQIPCDAFARNQEGRWIPTRTIVVNGITIAPGVSFTDGPAIGSSNLGKILENQCEKKKK
jgi:hypothetical protein